MLGEDIVDPSTDFEDQKLAVFAWLDVNVLPIADAEVSVPLLRVTGLDSVADFVNSFTAVAQAQRDAWILKGASLYDGAVLSYGRSEINKTIDSNAEGYDKDSDQDRIQGNQRLAKMLEWATALIASNSTTGNSSDDVSSAPVSQSVRVRAVW